MVCPICRRDFTIPIGGVKALPKNFLMGQLLTLNQDTGSSAAPGWQCFSNNPTHYLQLPRVSLTKMHFYIKFLIFLDAV